MRINNVYNDDMYYSNPCCFGKTINRQWSADPWC